MSKHVSNVNVNIDSQQALSVDLKNSNETAAPPPLNEDNEEDLLSFRNQLQEQLKLKLFNSTSLEHVNKNNKQVIFLLNKCFFFSFLFNFFSFIELF